MQQKPAIALALGAVVAAALGIAFGLWSFDPSTDPVRTPSHVGKERPNLQIPPPPVAGDATVLVSGHALGQRPGDSWAVACGQDAEVQSDDTFVVRVPPTESCQVRVFSLLGQSVALGPMVTVDARKDASVDVSYPAAGDLRVPDEASPARGAVRDMAQINEEFSSVCVKPAADMTVKCGQISVLLAKERRTIEDALAKQP